jgi:hypothetical protein
VAYLKPYKLKLNGVKPDVSLISESIWMCLLQFYHENETQLQVAPTGKLGIYLNYAQEYSRLFKILILLENEVSQGLVSVFSYLYHTKELPSTIEEKRD